VKEKVGDSSNYSGAWSPPRTCVEFYACRGMILARVMHSGDDLWQD
jgi:hypothetical protein